MIFSIFGHSNLLGTHYNTLEFTKEDHLTKEGDCIIGVKADFDPEKLKQLAKKFSKLKFRIKVGNLEEGVHAISNKEFDGSCELVIRKSEFPSKRTLGIKADKSAKEIDRRIIELLRNPGTKGTVEVIGYEESDEQ